MLLNAEHQYIIASFVPGHLFLWWKQYPQPDHQHQLCYGKRAKQRETNV
jgi:hypothetical protein